MCVSLSVSVSLLSLTRKMVNQVNKYQIVLQYFSLNIGTVQLHYIVAQLCGVAYYCTNVANKKWRTSISVLK